MKRLLSFLFLAAVTWMVLGACSPTDNLARGDAEKAPTDIPEVTEAAAAIRAPQVVGKEGGLYPPQDLSLVSTTGRPQLINSYADWCTTCQHNLPIVTAVSEQFAGKIDLINLNIDVAETQDVRDRFNIIDRSQYVFVDAAGNMVQRWYGFLDQTQVTRAIEDYLAK